MIKQRHVICACLLALLFIIIGCGGGGSSSNSTGTTATTSGGTDTLTLAYDLKGFTGKLSSDVQKSGAPQTVTLTVNGVARTITNVIVAEDLASGQTATVFSEGSKLLNATIPNASAGAVIDIGDPVDDLRAPISTDGVLGASVLCQNFTTQLTTPPATWQGHSMPNGVQVSFHSTPEGDRRIQVNASFTLPATVGASKTGTTTITYSTPSSFNTLAEFRSTAASIDVGGSSSTPATNGTTTGTWQTLRGQNGKPIFVQASID